MTTGATPGDATRPLPTRTLAVTAVTETARPGSPAPADERGRTTLADRVVEKIAARAALDAPHAGGLSRRVAGRDFGRPVVRAHAEIDGRVAGLRLELAVEYPASARATTRVVREHVRERVTTLCDLRVDHVDITVAVLRRPDVDRRPVR